MKLANLAKIAVLSIALAGCASDQINKDELAQVNSVAVVMFSVPNTIGMNTLAPEDIYQSKEAFASPSDLLSVAGDLVGGKTKQAADFVKANSVIYSINGQEAATLALPGFINELRKQEGWKVLAPADVTENPVYQSESTALLADDEIRTNTSYARKALGPKGFVQLGLPATHTSAVDYYNADAFKQWAAKSARALNVDAVVVVNDTGFATDSTGLFGGMKCYTKSAFHFAMFNANGELILDTRASFDESAKVPQDSCSNGNFSYADYKKALQQHGKDQAAAIVTKLKEMRS